MAPTPRKRPQELAGLADSATPAVKRTANSAKSPGISRRVKAPRAKAAHVVPFKPAESPLNLIKAITNAANVPKPSPRSESVPAAQPRNSENDIQSPIPYNTPGAIPTAGPSTFAIPTSLPRGRRSLAMAMVTPQGLRGPAAARVRDSNFSNSSVVSSVMSDVPTPRDPAEFWQQHRAVSASPAVSALPVGRNADVSRLSGMSRFAPGAETDSSIMHDMETPRTTVSERQQRFDAADRENMSMFLNEDVPDDNQLSFAAPPNFSALDDILDPRHDNMSAMSRFATDTVRSAAPAEFGRDFNNDQMDEYVPEAYQSDAASNDHSVNEDLQDNQEVENSILFEDDANVDDPIHTVKSTAPRPLQMPDYLEDDLDLIQSKKPVINLSQKVKVVAKSKAPKKAKKQAVNRVSESGNTLPQFSQSVTKGLIERYLNEGKGLTKGRATMEKEALGFLDDAQHVFMARFMAMCAKQAKSRTTKNPAIEAYDVAAVMERAGMITDRKPLTTLARELLDMSQYAAIDSLAGDWGTQVKYPRQKKQSRDDSGMRTIAEE